MFELFLITVFILLVVMLVLLIGVYLKLKSIPESTLPILDPDLVICSEADVLEAWIQGYPSKQGCPGFTNNYVVDNSYIMYEKFFLVDNQTQCCWFSNEITQRERFPNPWICVGSNRVFTLNELNAKPYAYDGLTTYYFNPACDSDPNCIALIRAGLSGEGEAIYKITKFKTESTDYYEGTAPPPDTSADVAQRLNIYVSENCQTLERMYLDGNLILDHDSNGDYFWLDSPEARSDIVKSIYEIFTRDRFYPIAGANPVLTNYASEYV